MVARQEDSWNCRLKKRNFVAQTLTLGPDSYQMTRLQQGHNFSGCGYESPLITAVDVEVRNHSFPVLFEGLGTSTESTGALSSVQTISPN